MEGRKSGWFLGSKVFTILTVPSNLRKDLKVVEGVLGLAWPIMIDGGLIFRRWAFRTHAFVSRTKVDSCWCCIFLIFKVLRSCTVTNQSVSGILENCFG